MRKIASPLLFARILADESAGTSIDIPVAPPDEMTQWPIRLYPLP
jgi:hypothetical protein